MADIAEELKKVRFKKKLFGGVSEEDVWRTIEQLQKDYQKVFDAQSEQNKALVQERNHVIRQMNAKMKELEKKTLSAKFEDSS